ncbi:MAG: alpha/beta hydrolase [Deltaproteobacteria bacterium]|nr:MAG: alpha/beta hydrolase [Deltaproteobacteria bacterium]
MPVDPQVALVLAQIEQLGLKNFTQASPSEARRLFEAATPAGAGEDVAAVEDRALPGPAGDVPVRIYTPVGAAPHPALVFFHGGGFVIGSVDTHDATCRALTNAARCVVVSVGYRLAPEHPFPAAPEDCYAATRWVAQNAAEIGVDSRRVAVGGDSAGGNLAAVVAQLARERGQPALLHQLLIYPVTNHGFDTASYTENAEGYLLERETMQWFWNHYLADASDGAHPKASPLRAADLSGLPPATVLTAEYDPLRDEGEAYAERLREAGVATVHTRYRGMIHGFFAMTDMLDGAKAALEQASGELRRAFKSADGSRPTRSASRPQDGAP